MSKQEKIREVIDTYCDDTCLYIELGCDFKHKNGWCLHSDGCYRCLMKRLGELGLVLKVEQQLADIGIEHYNENVAKILKARWTAWEPLIDVGLVPSTEPTFKEE